MPPADLPEGWGEYRRLILAELERIRGDLARLDNKMDLFSIEELSRLKSQVAVLEFKASLMGALGGLVAGLAVILVKFIS